MRRLNLSTQPFYNERIVNFVLSVSTIFLFLFFVRGFTQWRTLLNQEAALQVQILKEQEASDALAMQAIRLLRESTPADATRIAGETGSARRLVERRIFSWTAFLTDIEDTIPPSVMLTTVTPDVTDNGIFFSLGLRGRSATDLNLFLEGLERKSNFSQLLIKEEELGQDGDYLGFLEGLYEETEDDSEH